MNEHRGETALTLGGKSYAVRLTTNCLANLEVSLNARGSLHNVMSEAGYHTVRAVFHAALTTPDAKGISHFAQATPLEHVGNLIDESGGLPALGPTYFLLCVNAGLLDRELCETLNLIPKEKGPDAPSVDAPKSGEEKSPTPGT
jgi:hypothetical protein